MYTMVGNLEEQNISTTFELYHYSSVQQTPVFAMSQELSTFLINFLNLLTMQGLTTGRCVTECYQNYVVE